MSRWHAYLNTGKTIVEGYDGRSPLSVWLKDFFRQHKQMGSRDRKIISDLVYGFYRLGYSAPQISIENKLLCGLFVCNEVSNELIANLKPQWNDNISLTLKEKALYLQAEGLPWHLYNIFPWSDDLSNGIDSDSFTVSHLNQPNLYLRLRPHHKNIVNDKLKDALIPFSMLGDNCIMVPNATKIDQVLRIDEEVVVQDYNSQRVAEFLILTGGYELSLWDCCAGSGGKSIMAYDLDTGINLFVSDSRASILQNLTQRFYRAGISKFHAFIADLTAPSMGLPSGEYDYVIADVPCSGSGTWSRTPEQLYFFDHKKIKYYSDLQKNIVSNVIPGLKEGGHLTYITCSVFKEENEEVVDFIQTNFHLELKKMELLKGYEMKADTLFAATFKKLEVPN